jgi:uncharacterized repeat protein (TIGR03806 family)
MRTIYALTMVICMVAAAVVGMQSCNNQPTQNANTAAVNGAFQFKEKLSEYGFFTNQFNALRPAQQVVRYELSTPLFTDYAVKDRFVFLPTGATVKYTASGVLDFPDSTIIIKNFAYTNTAHQKIMIETRLLVKDAADKKWKVMNYLWNEEQTDAVKHITGARLPITLLDDEGKPHNTTYQVPNTNDCKRCHINNESLTPIGPKARNLNYAMQGQTDNQLAQWAAKGRLIGLPDLSKVEQLPNWKDDTHFSLEQRARAYLDMNCSHCHTKGGDAYNTGLFLEYQQTNAQQLGLMKVPVSAGGGAGGMNYDIVPGDAAHSILAYRMNSTETGTAMPELARTIIHKEGVQLIHDWIQNMPKRGKK